MKRIILKAGEEGRILAGHPWVYDNEVEKVLEGNSGKGPREAALAPGELAEVETVFRGKPRYLGRAFANPNSKILARIYSPSKEGVDRGFFKRRIREAVGRRLLYGGAGEGSYNLGREPARLVFAEADFLPGLIIDRFVGWPLAAIEENVFERPLDYDDVEARLGPPDSWIVIQFLCFGMEVRKEEIAAALEEVLGAPLTAGGKALGLPRGIVERSTARVRELEGLPRREGLIKGSVPPGGMVLFENGLPFAVSLEEGQKTGHFLDQRDNRLRAAAFASQLVPAGAGLRVLDGCSYTGAFAIHVLRLGDGGFNAGEQGTAMFADCVDSSPEALEMLRVNAGLNGVEDQMRPLEADIFEFLRKAERQKETYDMVILDPPAFAKSRTALGGAIRGYKEINLRALKLLRAGGILVSCSCSQALDGAGFKRMISEAACDAERRLHGLEFHSQAPDHPILVGYDESEYLKCGIFRVL
ncbi:MAG: class I SAM-dependent rRNA methyltransferase [Treponema sp.]|nr:class I SAM-dependent rRNA methyltransferase [Treponema sp.]